MDDVIRLRCPACETRMDLPPRTTYAACRHCGSEYLVQRRRGAWTLQPMSPQEVELSQELAAVERRQELGCANTAFSIMAFFLVLFCVIGGAGRLIFNNVWICFGAWVVAFALFVPLAITMLRNLERDRRRRERILVRKEAALTAAVAAEEAVAPPADGHAPEA
jgi:DNA-directed RNA polymerase subunit RPC12/RpoP